MFGKPAMLRPRSGADNKILAEAFRLLKQPSTSIEHVCVLTDLFSEPDSNDWHSSNDGVWIFLGSRVDGVVGSNNECQIKVLDLWVHLVHLVHNVIRNSRLGQKHVQLARHTSLQHTAHTLATDVLKHFHLCEKTRFQDAFHFRFEYCNNIPWPVSNFPHSSIHMYPVATCLLTAIFQVNSES